VSPPIQNPGSELILTLRELRGDLETFGKSPLLTIHSRGRVVVDRTQILLEQLEDLVDRVTLLEIAVDSSTLEKITP